MKIDPWSGTLAAILWVGLGTAVAQAQTASTSLGETLPSRGCGRSESAYPAGATSEGTMRQGRRMRTFRVHVPSGYRAGTAAPLVLMFHGGGGSGDQLEEKSSRMDAVADREGFIVVYPDGTGLLRTWNAGSCCGPAVKQEIDDVGFTGALLDHLEDGLCVDRRRIYASGMSNGALLSHRLACEMADRIAAIAPVAGVDVTSTCTPSRPVPVMQIHGTEDKHVPWGGGTGCGLAEVAFPSVPATVDAWRTRDHCSAARSPYLEQGDGRCEMSRGCTGGSDVVLCAIQGGGHSWPGGEPKRGAFPCPGDGFQSRTFPASEVMWRFFKEHALPAR